MNHIIFGIHSVISEHEDEDESWTDKRLSDHPYVLGVFSNNGHIDDINSGADTEVNRDDQSLSTQVDLWKQGCFGSEYLVYSGIKPGERVSLMEYMWNYLDIDGTPGIMLYTPGLLELMQTRRLVEQQTPILYLS